MILGLTHIGITVANMDEIIARSGEEFGFKVISDAERQGPITERITATPGMHTRTVYMNVTGHQHFELFQFFNPPSLSAAKPKGWHQEGFIYGVMEHNEQTATETDVAGLLLRMPARDRNTGKMVRRKERPHIYPVLAVRKIDAALAFYEGVLGLCKYTDKQSFEPPLTDDGTKSPERLRRVTLTAPDGICLELVQPLDTIPEPTGPWQMQRIGFTHFAMWVTRIADIYQRLKDREINCFSPPQQVGVGPHKGGQCFYLQGPGEIVIELLDTPMVQKDFADFL